MCNHNPCEGSGWRTSLFRDGPGQGDVQEETEVCECNPEMELPEEHADKECIRDVTLGP